MSFEQHVLNKLDDLCAAQARTNERLAALETKLEERTGSPKGSLKRDGTLVISGSAVTALLSFLASHFSKAAQ